MKAPRTRVNIGAVRFRDGYKPPQTLRRRRIKRAAIVGSVAVVLTILSALITLRNVGADDGVVCAAQATQDRQARLTICPPSNENVVPRVWLAGVWR